MLGNDDSFPLLDLIYHFARIILNLVSHPHSNPTNVGSSALPIALTRILPWVYSCLVIDPGFSDPGLK